MHRSRTYRRHSPQESAPLVIAANGAEFFRYPTSFTDRLQFKRRPEHDGAAAEGVVVGVGVDAVEEGVGVVALVQEVVEFEAENEALPFVLGRGVEEGHALVLSPLLPPIGEKIWGRTWS